MTCQETVTEFTAEVIFFSWLTLLVTRAVDLKLFVRSQIGATTLSQVNSEIRREEEEQN